MRTDTGHRIYIHNTNCSLVKSNGTTQHTLRLRVTHGSNRIDLRTRIRVEPKLWDKRKQRVKQGYNVNGCSYNDVNSTINTYIQYVDEYFHECELMKRDPVLTDLRAKFNPNRSLGPISLGDIKVFSCSPESKECLSLVHRSYKT